jgi:hypothetical protein
MPQHADVLWHWLGTLAVCLWWWQPLAWMARRGLRMESEQAADDAAVLQSGDTPAYARTLVEIAAGMPAKLRHAAGVTMFGGGQVKQRVEALLRTNRWRGRIGLGAMVLLAFLGLALAVLVATTFEFAPKKPVFRSLAKLVAGGRMVASGETQWKEMFQDFYGTIIETIESAEMQRKARERVHALHPELKDHDVDIRVAQTKGSAIFNVLATGDDPKYTQIYLNALLDEFIAFRQAIREQAQGKVLSTFLQEVVIKQKVMEEKSDLLVKFTEKNNILSVTNKQNELAYFLTQMNGQRTALKTRISEIAAATLSDAAAMSEMAKLYQKTKAEHFVLKNDRDYLLKSRQPDHPEVVAMNEKVLRTEHMLESMRAELRGEQEAEFAALQRRLEALDHEIAETSKAALEAGAVLAEHKKLQDEAEVAKQAYQRMFERAETFQNMFNVQSDYVAVQERATTAAEYIESSLFPVWKLWTPKK